jgi:rod shape-determining protein MreD
MLAPRVLAGPAPPRLDNAAVRLLPIVTTAAAVLLALLPFHIPGYAALTPGFTLMAAYHWTMYRPDLLPPSALFAIGALQDLLCGAPLGPSALLLLLLRAGVLKQRRPFVGRSFPFVWAGFTVVTAVTAALLWAIYLFLDGAGPELPGTVFRAVLTVSLFPLASYLLGSTQRALMAAG